MYTHSWIGTVKFKLCSYGGSWWVRSSADESPDSALESMIVVGVTGFGVWGVGAVGECVTE